jgi:hypothetical protein
MHKIFLAAAAASVAAWAQPASATQTLQGHVSITGTIGRSLNFDDDQSSWLPSCAGETTCTYSDTYPVFTVFNVLVQATSVDGVNFTMSFDDDYCCQGSVSLEGQVYPYITDGTWIVSALRSPNGEFQVDDVQFSSSVTSDNFTGALQLVSLSSASFVAVPEPSTWAMMLLGFVAIGFQVRRMRNSASVAYRVI